jgi:superkiller protein 3
LCGDEKGNGLRAKEETAWCSFHLGDTEVALMQFQDVHQILKDFGGHEADTARCLWRLGQCYWREGGMTSIYVLLYGMFTFATTGSKREEAYACFIASLSSNAEYAPAFTSLGIYYSEFASPPDISRASKCFQKAFELDPCEVDAARRLAHNFAEEREWDLVEVVSQRVIAGESGVDVGVKNPNDVPTVQHGPTTAWAWKALGVVELVRQHFSM